MGTAYFAHVLGRMDGNVELALAGYNGGPNRILRKWREAGGRDDELDLFLEQLDISESQAYVKRILVLVRQLSPALPRRTPASRAPSGGGRRARDLRSIRRSTGGAALYWAG